MQLGGGMRHGSAMTRLDFETEPDLDLDPGSIFPLFQHGDRYGTADY